MWEVMLPLGFAVAHRPPSNGGPCLPRCAGRPAGIQVGAFALFWFARLPIRGAFGIRPAQEPTGGPLGHSHAACAPRTSIMRASCWQHSNGHGPRAARIAGPLSGMRPLKATRPGLREGASADQNPRGALSYYQGRAPSDITDDRDGFMLIRTSESRPTSAPTSGPLVASPKTRTSDWPAPLAMICPCRL